MASIGTLNNKQVLLDSNFDSNNLSTDFKHQIFYKEIKAHYNLRNPKSNKPTVVYLVTYINKKQTRISTGYKVYPKQCHKSKAITMLSLRGWEYNQIARYSGHRTLTTLQTYDKSKVGTKYKIQFEDTKKYHPEQLLEMVDLEGKKVEQPKVPYFIHTEVANVATYGIDREADISNLTKEELDYEICM